MTHSQYVLLLAGWTLYAVVHSLLASTSVKQWTLQRWPGMGRRYRMMFNLSAVILLLPLAVALYVWQGPMLWEWRGILAWLANGLAVAALIAFVWSLRFYDTAVFSGFTQWRLKQGEPDGNEHFTLSPLHRYVRHPWYALALVILWTRDMDEVRLVSTLCITLYFWLGSRLEERKLIARHGSAYARYRQRVNSLLPWPGRVLDKAQAHLLLQQAKQETDGSSRKTR